MIQATINFRIHLTLTVQETPELLKNIEADDYIQFHLLSASDPCLSAPLTIRPWASSYSISHTVCLPGSQYCSPGIFTGNTDCKPYVNFTTGIGRSIPFTPSVRPSATLKESRRKISVQAYKTQVNFTFEFIQTADTDRDQFLTCTNCEVEPAGLGVPDLGPGLTQGESQC